jgi:hypothetical protein
MEVAFHHLGFLKIVLALLQLNYSIFVDFPSFHGQVSRRADSLADGEIKKAYSVRPADFPRVVVHMQASCAHAHESSLSMLMELS